MSGLKIQFNLFLGGNKITKIEDFKEYFFIYDLMDSYYNGSLVKWLDNNGYYAQREIIKDINSEDPKEILAKLMKVLNISYFPDEIEEAVATLDSIKSKGHLKKILGVSDSDDEEIFEEEKEEEPKGKTIDEFVEEIVENHLDLNKIYDTLDELTKVYPEVLKENYEEFFDKLHAKRPHTLLALFGHHATRPYYIADKNFVSKVNQIAKVICDDIRSVGDEKLRRYPFIIFKKVKEPKNIVWTTIEEPNKKFMLFYCQSINPFFNFFPLSSEIELEITFAGTYTHHNEIKPRNIPTELPVLEGLNVKGSDDVFIAYIEAR